MIDTFIKESNLIDTQHDEYGKIVPGFSPGDILYDNHIEAIKAARRHFNDVLYNGKILYKGICLDVHRELTRGIWFFESQEMSGKYRNFNVRIGNEKLPPHYVVRGYVEEKWIPSVDNLLTFQWASFNKEDLAQMCLNIHYAYECIHPFIDGNGRSGRCIYWALCQVLNIEPEIFYYDKRHEYYNSIRKYRREQFEKFIGNQ